MGAGNAGGGDSQKKMTFEERPRDLNRSHVGFWLEMLLQKEQQVQRC